MIMMIPYSKAEKNLSKCGDAGIKRYVVEHATSEPIFQVFDQRDEYGMTLIVLFLILYHGYSFLINISVMLRISF